MVEKKFETVVPGRYARALALINTKVEIPPMSGSARDVLETFYALHSDVHRFGERTSWGVEWDAIGGALAAAIEMRDPAIDLKVLPPEEQTRLGRQLEATTMFDAGTDGHRLCEAMQAGLDAFDRLESGDRAAILVALKGPLPYRYSIVAEK